MARLVSAIGWVVPAFSAFDIKSQVVHGIRVPAGFVACDARCTPRSTSAALLAAAVGRVLAAGVQVSGRAPVGVVGIASWRHRPGAARRPARARDAATRCRASTERLLYLRSGKAADRLMLSFDALAADVYWIRAIQHYGRDRKTVATPDRFELLQPLLDLTTTLDPHFNIAYRFGAIFLALEPPNGPGRADQAIALLEKGLAEIRRAGSTRTTSGSSTTGTRGDYAAAARLVRARRGDARRAGVDRPLAAMTRREGGDRAGRAADADRAARVARSAYIRARGRAGSDPARRARRDRRAAGASSSVLRAHADAYPADWPS